MAPTAKEFNSNNTISLTPAGESDEERLEFVELMTKNCDAVQKQVLAEILEQNKDTEYLRRHGLGDATDLASFKSKIPVVTYDHLKPYIQRIADGDRFPILSQQPISEFLTSSGTSGGERKLMPTTQEEQDRRLFLHKLADTTIRKAFPKVSIGKALFFYFVKSETKTPGGIIARPALTSYFKSPYSQAQFDSPSSIYTSPLAAVICPDIHQSTYIQLLCGLYHRLQVLSTGSTYASGFLRIIHFLQTHWQQLSADIATGSLSYPITDPSLRASVADILRPDPDLAHFVADECSKSDWAGIITRIWPNTKFINLTITGSMAQYVPSLQFYSGGRLPLVSNSYASSECYFGINLNPLCRPSEILYTLLPNFGYFEFAAVDGDEGELVDLADVKIGSDYELVVTTYAGLYRYRVGDVLRVRGFHNSAPQIEFLKRKSVVLSIDTDKTDEAELQRAVERAAEVLGPIGFSVAEYTSQAFTETLPGHYIIYWELLQRQIGEEGGLSKELEGEVMEKCCMEMEEALNSVYRQCRVAECTIGPLEIRVVQSGTFEELMDYALSTGASLNQYKVPRCVGNKPVLELLNSRVVSAHFSKGLPRWNPNRFERKD